MSRRRLRRFRVGLVGGELALGQRVGEVAQPKRQITRHHVHARIGVRRRRQRPHLLDHAPRIVQPASEQLLVDELHGRRRCCRGRNSIATDTSRSPSASRTSPRNTRPRRPADLRATAGPPDRTPSSLPPATQVVAEHAPGDREHRVRERELRILRHRLREQLRGSRDVVDAQRLEADEVIAQRIGVRRQRRADRGGLPRAAAAPGRACARSSRLAAATRSSSFLRLPSR